MYKPCVLLDTCALLWLATGSDKLSDKALNVIEAASIVYVSAITAWEISLKTARGNLTLPIKPSQWFATALEQHKLTLASLDVDILLAANELPWLHRDPADRFIIATALKLNATIVTTDKLIEQYDIAVIH
ncbi:MAG: type II toxin-antitoxin system VapC family toxin [Deltaproteobacteria bacterium]|nr:type II toxin-antitoxin system VapC family toxin [Deltaproteobacteria bacterium]